MKAEVKVGGRRVNKDPRNLHNWVGKLEVKATREGDQFILAAVYRALFGGNDKAVELREAIANEAEKCRDAHREREKETGLCATIK